MRGPGRMTKMQLVSDKKNSNTINLINNIQKQIQKQKGSVSPQKETKGQTMKSEFSKNMSKSPQICEYDQSWFAQANALFNPNKKNHQNLTRLKTQGFININQMKSQNLRQQLDKITKIRQTETTKSLHKSNHTMDICYSESHFPTRGIISNCNKHFPPIGIPRHPSLDSGLKYSFSKQKRVLVNDKEGQSKQYVPAPNQYNYFKEKIHHKNGKFPLAPRKTLTTNDNPGPGVYNLENYLVQSQGGYLSKQKRLKSYQSDTPGPAVYQTIPLNSIKKKMPSIVIGRSELEKCQSRIKMVPAPNQYSVKESLCSSRVKGGTIGKSSRGIENKDESPGPLNYSPKYCQILIRSPSAIIGKQLRKSYGEYDDSWDNKLKVNGQFVENLGEKFKKIFDKNDTKSKQSFRRKSKSQMKNKYNLNK